MNTERLPVFDMFYSVQGEGCNAGTAAFFIRLAGCNVGCDFCDEKSAWDIRNAKLSDAATILDAVKAVKATNVVVTGGEPTLYDLTDLTQKLCEEGIKTFLETSGVNKITGHWDWITLSPKQNKLPLPESLYQADELKVVIAKNEDFLFAESMRKAAMIKNPNVLCYLQSEYSQRHTVLSDIIDYIKQNPVWKLSLQTHKMINIK
ncbi:MAG: 7-carboxy-7-deazaguanine synthase QueE [Bacteroidales bacterium]|nr:7-carboxy-7-deazaguanine synthase QueE [Bacteroidales bacterium]